MGMAAFALVGASVVFTSFLSGIFGMAGGLVLLGILLLLLDVAPAMMLFGVTQLAANGWRAILGRRFIRWDIFRGYAAGSLVFFGLMKLVAFLPDKGFVYLGLGLMPFAVEVLPHHYRPHIERRFAPFLCGGVIMVLQLLVGAAGNVLDVFFQKSSLDRKTVVATKAATQTLAHFLRILYFGSFAFIEGDLPPLWLFGACIILAFLGTSLAARVLERWHDEGFRKWSRVLILSISAIYIVRGAWLLAQ